MSFWATKRDCVRQWNSVHQHNSCRFLQTLGNPNQVRLRYPSQANGHVESSNKVILNSIKKKLEAAKGL